MEWVETTAKTVEEAREAALDQLGVGSDDAEFEIVEEPRPGLFGRMRGSARVRARVKPTPVRPKQDRRRRGRDKPKSKQRNERSKSATSATSSAADEATDAATDAGGPDGVDRSAGTGNGGDAGSPTGGDSGSKRRRQRSRGDRTTNQPSSDEQSRKQAMSEQHERDEEPTSDVTPQEVGDAAVAFMTGLTDAFGADASTALEIDGTDLSVTTTGSELGLLVGSSGRTLNAIQDLARVSAQRRLGDHVTRLRIDVAGYRERRQAALARFAQDVAESVRSSGSPRSLEPMSSADRKVIHDVLNEEDGVESRSEGEDPNRRVVVLPA